MEYSKPVQTGVKQFNIEIFQKTCELERKMMTIILNLMGPLPWAWYCQWKTALVRFPDWCFYLCVARNSEVSISFKLLFIT